jgi:hypothetical protein
VPISLMRELSGKKRLVPTHPVKSQDLSSGLSVSSPSTLHYPRLPFIFLGLIPQAAMALGMGENSATWQDVSNHSKDCKPQGNLGIASHQLTPSVDLKRLQACPCPCGCAVLCNVNPLSASTHVTPGRWQTL